MLSKKDLFVIIDAAKNNMFRSRLPMYISGKQVEQEELVSIAVLEAALTFLNSKKLLTSLVNLDYTDPACDIDVELPLEEEPKQPQSP